MASASWLTDALAVADAATEALGLVVEVTHEAWVGQDGAGKPIFATAVSRKAMVQEGSIPHKRSAEGDTVVTRAVVAFQDVIEPNGAAGRTQEPIDAKDRITLPSGRTGPIADVKDALVDPATGRVLRSVAWLR